MENALRKERDQLEKQNQVRSIFTGIIPTLLNESPKEKKKIVLKQMLDMIEKCMLHQECKEMTKFKHGHINSDNVGNI